MTSVAVPDHRTAWAAQPFHVASLIDGFHVVETATGETRYLCPSMEEAREHMVILLLIYGDAETRKRATLRLCDPCVRDPIDDR